jgi:hypothetical protein
MGLHTIDTVRRDAAEERIRFETRYTPDGNKTEVLLTDEQVKLVYIIDMETDVIEKIKFSTANGDEGELRFSYLQNIDDARDEFTTPRAGGNYRKARKEPPGMLWFVKLTNGHQ